MIHSVSLGAVIELIVLTAVFAVLQNKIAAFACFFAAIAIGAVAEIMTPDHEEEWTEEEEEDKAA